MPGTAPPPVPTRCLAAPVACARQLETARSLSSQSLEGQASILAAQLEEAHHVAEAAKALILSERQRNAELQAAAQVGQAAVCVCTRRAQPTGLAGLPAAYSPLFPAPARRAPPHLNVCCKMAPLPSSLRRHGLCLVQEAEMLRQQLEQQMASSWELQEAFAAAEAAMQQMQADLAAAQEQAARFQRQAQNMEGYGHQLQEVRRRGEAGRGAGRQEGPSETAALDSGSGPCCGGRHWPPLQWGALAARLSRPAMTSAVAPPSVLAQAESLQAQLAAVIDERDRLQQRSEQLEAEVRSTPLGCDCLQHRGEPSTVPDAPGDVREAAQRVQAGFPARARDPQCTAHAG